MAIAIALAFAMVLKVDCRCVPSTACHRQRNYHQAVLAVAPPCARASLPRHFHTALKRSCQPRTFGVEALRAKPRDLTQDVSESMESVLEQHARRILEVAQALEGPQKYVVLIAGAPGSGKTSTAHVSCDLLNRLGSSDGKEDIAVVASMDGFHYPRSHLDGMDDPEEAHARRGAHWTFDAARFVEAVGKVRSEGSCSWPSFDHAEGDPVPDDLQILPSHKVVLVEGNYVLLGDEPWHSLAEFADESWFISCNLETAMDRVIARQIGNGSDLKTAQWRVTNNDRPNAELIQQCAVRATHVIPSLPYKDPEKLLRKEMGPEE